MIRKWFVYEGMAKSSLLALQALGQDMVDQGRVIKKCYLSERVPEARNCALRAPWQDWVDITTRLAHEVVRFCME